MTNRQSTLPPLEQLSKNGDTASPFSLHFSQLEKTLSLNYGGQVTDLLTTVFFQPMENLLNRPGKKIRGRLVKLGLSLSDLPTMLSPETLIKCLRLVEAVELLHSGSLAVDDVQDGSKMRRGQPSLHLKYGLPVALNIGNWLYFRPLEIIGDLGLPSKQELHIYKTYHRTLLRAHLGQALDVGLQINTLPQERVEKICLATLELKSGAIFSLALLMGAILANTSPDQLAILDKFGHGFGIGLQMFDDLGNIHGQVEPAKRWEDLVLRRPTWIWACAARNYSPDIYQEFVAAAERLPQSRSRLQKWFEERNFLSLAKRQAHQHMESCFSYLSQNLPELKPEVLLQLRSLGEEISKAYD